MNSVAEKLHEIGVKSWSEWLKLIGAGVLLLALLALLFASLGWTDLAGSVINGTVTGLVVATAARLFALRQRRRKDKEVVMGRSSEGGAGE